MTEEKRYASSLDNIAKYLPWIIIVFVVVTVLIVSFTDPTSQTSDTVIAVIIPVVVVLGVVGPMYAARIRYLTMNDNAITIARKWWPTVIPFSDILSVRRVDNMRFAFRTFGNGGIFGYTGKYYKRGIGSMTWYCTQRRNYILIETTNNQKSVITPDDPDGFIKGIEAKYPLLVV